MTQTIKKDVKQGLAWTSFGKLLTQLFTWTSTFFVIKILTPDDYGIIEICVAVISLSFVLSEGGLADAIVRYKNSTGSFINEIFTVSLMLNVFFYFIIWHAAPLVSAFFAEDDLTYALRVVALQLPISSFFIVPLGILRLKMNFKVIAIVEGIAGVSNAAFTLSFAMLGYGYWSLVFGVIAGSLVKAIALNFKVRAGFRLTKHFKEIGKAARFSSFTVLNRLLWLFYTKIDVVIVGRIISTSALGYYSVALQIASLPLIKVGAIINQVSFTAYSKINDDIKQVRYYYLLSNKVLSLISFPIFFGIAATAPNFVPLLIGGKWEQAIVPLQILALVVPFRVLSLGTQAMFQGLGKPEINTQNLLVAVIFTPVCMLIGINYGIAGAALGWSVGFIIYFVFIVIKAMKVLQFSKKTYLLDISIPLVLSLSMFIFLININHNEFTTNNLYLLMVKVIVGFIFYGGLLIILGRKRFVIPLISLLRK